MVCAELLLSMREYGVCVDDQPGWGTRDDGVWAGRGERGRRGDAWGSEQKIADVLFCIVCIDLMEVTAGYGSNVRGEAVTSRVIDEEGRSSERQLIDPGLSRWLKSAEWQMIATTRTSPSSPLDGPSDELIQKPPRPRRIPLSPPHRRPRPGQIRVCNPHCNCPSCTPSAVHPQPTSKPRQESCCWASQEHC